MLLREDDQGVLAIGQLSHSWMCGQFARAWGNERFGAVVPLEEVALGAQQHDLGMSAWDEAPPRNRDTGLPYSFTEMPVEVSLRQWRDGPRRLASQSRYAALLASMHGSRLFEGKDLTDAPDENARAIRSYLDDQRRFQQQLTTSLRRDPAAAATATPRMISRNSDLVWAWDLLSLALVLGADWAPRERHQVPTATGECALELLPADMAGRLSLRPWPFSKTTMNVRCEGRRLDRRYDSDRALSDALAQARWETLEFILERG
jgi:hypothetical protein